MFILFGIKINPSKKIRYSLKKLFGIGISRANTICNALSIPENTFTFELTDFQKTNISIYIKKHFAVESKLKQQIFENIEDLKIINCVKGFRHRYKLPVRGQRTRSNAKTSKKLLK
jgi:small subunit ribosomal protein S13